jgi:hypothetical protein
MGYPVAVGVAAGLARRQGPLEAKAAQFGQYSQRFHEHAAHLRKVSVGTCGRAFGTPCHEHACVRCSLLRPDPAQRARLEEIRRNLEDRILEAQLHGWLGEVEGLQVSLAGAKDKLAQINDRIGTLTAVDRGTPPLPTNDRPR